LEPSGSRPDGQQERAPIIVLAVASKLSPLRGTERLPDLREFGVSEMFLVAGLTVLAVAQGGFYGRGRSAAEILLALALVSVIGPGRTRRQTRRQLGPAAWVLIGIGALAVAGVVAALVSGRLAGLAPYVLMLGALAVAVLVPATAGSAARRQLVDALIAVGVFLAASGWLGVVWRLTALAHPDGGIWRASTTVTYANASAAILSMLALWAIARLAAGAGVSRTGRLSQVATMLLLTGLAATLSRAGIGAFFLGLVVLCGFLGLTSVITRVWRAVAGAILATVGLLPGLQASGPSRPVWACVGLAAGLGVAVAPWHHIRQIPSRSRVIRAPRRAKLGWIAVAALGLVTLLAALVLGLGRHGSVWSGRLSLASPDRTAVTDAALKVWDKHFLTGVGPGQTIFFWTTDKQQMLFDHFAHDEYLQLAVEEGIVGLAGLAVLIAGAAVTLIRGWQSARRLGPASGQAALTAGAIAGLVAFGVHGAFDFLWHVPLVPLLAATALGFAAPLPGARKQQPAAAAAAATTTAAAATTH
jgi:hypothetical protein